MVDREINSKYLKETMTLTLYKPKNFSKRHKYNICIMQDGNDYFQIGRIATLSDRLHENNAIARTVFIGIHYEDKYDRRRKYHPDGEFREAYINFLIYEVVPLLNRIIPTSSSGQSWTLMGDSLAGTLALMTTLKYPQAFGKVIMQSPFVNETVLEFISQTKANNVNPIDIYHTIGENESAVHTTDGRIVDFLTLNHSLKKQLENIAEKYYFSELEAGEHTWKYWQKDLPNALIRMLK